MRRFIGNVGRFVTEAAVTPVMGVAECPGRLGSCGVFATRVVVIGCDVVFNIPIADTTVVAITSLGLQTNGTATFTKVQSCRFAAAANVAIVETVTAVLTEMGIVVTIFHTQRRRIRTIGISLAAVQAKCTNLADLDLAESCAAIRAEMLVPLGVFYTVFPAGAARRRCVVHTTEYAKTAIITKVDAFFIQTLLALFTKDTTFLTVIVSGIALRVGTVTVAALNTVHIFHFPADLAEAAAIT